ncbi:MAG: 2-carboxy-1,4-naphthoquinone phytyltransferase [Plectolyngbya sp. WJT66-NPBG17]|jgi:1,4-dihydroxy-2-naphthoate octaprenyltransferase|nr:2-carboxy-1,4-naphthoquinone phytyltransferase [Plectolyngbya sp. WJT66-NPBG17]MBW4525312.1 2-carboxy-1,4-naphthoquinone phytyltransferase [Phormidium tanganyikae FI6-MK23]
MTPRSVESSKKKLWYAAIKPPMYSVAVMPIWVGSAVAFAETRSLNLVVFFTFSVSAILILAWENLSNDVFDSETGVDVNKANSVVNITGNKSLVFWIANFFLASGLSGILSIALLQRDFTVIGLVLACCAIGYVYQGPPFRLSYKGLGEPLCFLAFGPLAFAAAYYSQTKDWSSVNFAASIGVGIATSLVLFCSHFNQVKDDAAIGKKSPVVRLGAKRSAELLPWICGSFYALTILFVILKIFPFWTLLSLLSFPIAKQLCQMIGSQYDQPHKLLRCRLTAVKLHFWFGMLFGLGFLLS